MDNLLLATDSYKVTHHLQYPAKTEYVYSYFESRGGKFPVTVFFGLQYVMKKWLVGRVVTAEKIAEAREISHLHFGADHFNEKGWQHILDHHEGRLPIIIKAVPEGTVVPTRNVLFTVENTDPRCYWLTNYLESLLVQTWYPTNVATISWHMKKTLRRHLLDTADNLDSLQWKLHDFGFRGATSVEAASIGGAGHLINFLGSDTLGSLWLLRKFYHESMAGFSIPATEHSTTTSWGRDGELAAYRHVLDTFPSTAVSCVSDSYNLWNACERLWAGPELKARVEARQHKLIIRPDSGEPTQVVPRLLEVLGDKFGYSVNSRGFKLLPACLRVIQGDGVDVDSLDGMCQSIRNCGWSLENVAFGCGGGLMQKHNRDTQKCAYKSSCAIVDGEERMVYKDPITDPGKKSKKGRLSLQKTQDGGFITLEEGTGDPNKDCLVTVFENGSLLKDWRFTAVRQNAENVHL